jgi:hypothetical protein
MRVSRHARGQAATVGGLLIFTFCLGAQSMAQTGSQPPDTAAWARCQQAPTRRCVLRRALEVAKAPKDGERDTLLNLFMIAAAQADAGLAQDASATVDLLRPLLGPDTSNPMSPEVNVLADRIKAIVARTQADLGKPEQAMSAASAIGEAGIRGATIGLIAIAEGKAGSIDNALKRVQSVQDDEVRAVAIRRAAWGLRFIATQRGEDGKIAEALRQSQSMGLDPRWLVALEELIPQIPYVRGFPERSNAWLNMPALQIVVEAQVRAGKVAEAMQAVRLVEPGIQSYWAKETVRRAEGFERARVFAAIVKYLAGDGRVSEALRLARELGDPLVLDNPFVLDNFAWDRFEERIVPASRRSRQYADVGDGQPEMRAGPQGKVDHEALVVARAFPAEGRAAALHMLAEVLARAGEPERSAEAAQLIHDPRHRIGALIAVGIAQGKAGFRAAAQAAFGEAVQIAQSFRDDMPIPRIAAHNVQRAVLAHVAAAQARAGMTAEALQTARLAGEQGYFNEPELVSDLVRALAEGGNVDEAIRTTGRLGQYREDLVLGAAAAALARAGHGAAALQVAAAIPGPPSRVAALAEIARALRRAGADGGAATAVRSAMSAVDSEWIGALIPLSRALPD